MDHQDPPPITELLQGLSGSSSHSQRVRLIHDVERLFRGGDTRLLPATAGQQGAYKSLVSSLIGCAALPDCEDDCASLPSSAYQDAPSRAVAVCSALTAILGLLRRGGGATELLLAIAPDVCVFAVPHFQVSVSGRERQEVRITRWF